MTLQNFRYVAIAEASSWLLLIIATIVKYGADGPDLAPILGPIHGLLFVAYILMAFTLRTEAGWDRPDDAHRPRVLDRPVRRLLRRAQAGSRALEPGGIRPGAQNHGS